NRAAARATTRDPDGARDDDDGAMAAQRAGALAPALAAARARRRRAGGAAPLADLHPAHAARRSDARHARGDARRVAQLRHLARLRRHVPARRARGRRAPAHVPQPRGHRAQAARRRRDLCRRPRRVRARARCRHGGPRADRARRRRRRRHARRRRRRRHRDAVDRARRRAPRPPAARPRHAVVVVSARPVARVGVRALSARGHRVRGTGGRRAAAAAGHRRRRCERARPQRRRRPRRRQAVPARRPAVARRVEGGRARRRLGFESVRGQRRRRCRRARLGGVAGLARRRDGNRAADGVGARRRACGARIRAGVAGHATACRAGSRPPARRADGARAVRAARRRRAHACERACMIGRRKQPLAAAARTRASASAVLSATQLRWLGAMLIAAQLPQAPHLPLWIAAFGLMLVGVRLWLARSDARRPGAAPARIPSWALVVFALVTAWFVRLSYGGHLAGREPSVAFLFILVGIKFLESRTRRDGTLLVCLASFLLITPFLTSQSPLAALAALPAILGLGGALDALDRTSGAAPPWRTTLARIGVMLLQGVPLAALLFFLFPRLAAPLWGLPQDYAAQSGLSDTMSPGMISELSLSDAVAFRVDFDGTPPPPALRYWRGPVLARFDGRTWSGLPQRGEGTLASPGGPAVR